MSVGTIVLLVYLAGALLALVPTARALLHSVFGDDGTPDSSDYVMAATLAICCVSFWPLYLPILWIVAVLKNDKPKVPR